jgi:tetratricopeptide (TPR) repeat protein
MKPNRKNKQTENIKASKSSLKVFLLFLVLVPLVLYFRVANFEFSTLDDTNIIVAHYNVIGDIKNISQAFTHDAFMDNMGVQFYRPMQTISFMLDAQLGGKEAWIYHLSNLIWHILVVIALFFFLNIIGIKKEISFLLALFFSINPLFANAVAWVPARGDILLCFFSLLSFMTFLEYFSTRKTIYILLHAIVFLLAVFSKETVVLLPIIILSYLYFVEKKKFILRNIIPFVAIWCLSFILFYCLRRFVLNASMFSEYFGIIPFIKNLPSIPITFGKFFFPYNLSTMPFFDNTALILGTVLIIIFSVITIKVTTGERRIVIYGAIWFLAFSFPPMFLRSYISDIGYEYFDYRAYLPIIGILIISGFLINKLSASVSFKKMLVFSIPILLVYSITAFFHSAVYADPISFFTSAIKVNPQNSMAFNSRGCMYLDNGRTNEAIADFDNSIKACTTYSVPYNNKGLLYRSLGDHKRAEYYLSLALYYDTLYPKANQEFAYINLSSEKLSLKKYEEAIVLVKKGIEKYSDDRSLHNNLGLAYYYTGKFDSAVVEYNKAIQSESNSFIYYNNRGKSEFRLNHYPDAMSDFNKALELKPDFSDAYFYRGLTKMNLNKFEEAISDFNMRINLDSRSGEAYHFRGIAYSKINKQKEARDNMNKAIELGYNGKD